MFFVQDVIEPLYRQRQWRRYRIVAPRKRASYCLALACTYGVGTDFTIKNIRSCVNRVGKLWVDRLWELGRHELWLYQQHLMPDQHNINPDKLSRAFALYADCRCRCVAYMPPQSVKERYIDERRKPCNRSNFCPHCWAMASARQCQRTREIINAYVAANQDSSISVTAQTSEYFFSSAGVGGLRFSTPEDRYAAIMSLRAEIEKCKRGLQRKHKTVQRNTLASAWRSLAVPAEDGWRIQLRQLFLTTGNKKPPLETFGRMRQVSLSSARVSGGHTWEERKTKLDMDNDVYACLMSFNKYPIELLTEDIELVGAYLNATAATRLLGGSGKLRRVGRALVREYVQKELALKNAKPRRI